jgi:antitoxin (DNA-binding transcriptional repressor) of toxin-antitoxin stability system
MQKNNTTAHESEVTRADALLLFKLINDKAVSKDARHRLAEYVDEVLNAAPITDATNNRPLFLRGFVEGWQQVGGHSRRNVGEILQRVKSGETLESVITDFQRQMTSNEEAHRGGWLNMPEPKDKTSDEWRYWKLRRMEKAFDASDREAYAEAWREFRALLDGLMAEPDFWHTGNARTLLPDLIIARQEIDRTRAFEKRQRAKGAA